MEERSVVLLFLQYVTELQNLARKKAFGRFRDIPSKKLLSGIQK